MFAQCYCVADGIRIDPDSGLSCYDSAAIYVPIDTFALQIDKAETFGSTTLVIVNEGGNPDVPLLWNLSAPAGVAWKFTPPSGQVAGGKVTTVEIALAPAELQARRLFYEWDLNLTSNSFHKSDRSKRIAMSAVISATPVASQSMATMRNTSELTASGTVDFDVTSIDASGMVILDAEGLAYSAALVHSASSVSVSCSVSYDTSSERHKGICELQGLEAGGFELSVLFGSGFVGGGAYHVIVESCPDSFELSDDGLSCTCPAGRYELGNTCAECADGTHKPSPGTERADCVACTSPEMSSEAHTACDTCITGYYRKGDSCAPCPTGDICTVIGASGILVPAPGFWRAGDESTEILQCRYGELACPGDSTANPATGPDPYCAAEYEGPLCSQCTDEYFISWDGSGECRECAAGKSHAPTLGLGAGVLVFVGLLLAGASKLCEKRDTDAPPNDFFVEAEKLYLLADVKFFTLFLSAQADTTLSHLLFVRVLRR